MGTTYKKVLLLLAAILVLVYVYPKFIISMHGNDEKTKVILLYQVEQGDTLWGIANKLVPDKEIRKAVWDIKNDNSLESADVFPGQVLEVEATAYTHVETPGVADINGTGDGITATGLTVGRGVAAVDPSVIPLHSLLYIDGYGYAIAEDVGGAVKGKRIDLFYESKDDALEFGRQDIEVKIVRIGE